MAELKHGTPNAYANGGCRCDRCGRAARLYCKKRRTLKNRGEWNPWGDLDAVRAHLARLKQQGMGAEEVSERANVARSVLYMIREGRTKRVKMEVAARILAVGVDFDLIPALSRVDASGTRRRLEALQAVGWSLAEIAPLCGVSRRTLHGVMDRPAVQVGTARAVRDVYSKLWDQEPPTFTDAQRRSVDLTRRRAAQQGWLPPAAWEDELLDQPDEQMWAVLNTRVAKWRLADLRRAAESFDAGDRSPLTVAAARECERREAALAARKSRQEAAHVG